MTDLTFHDYHSPGVFNGMSLSAWKAFVDEFPKLGGFNFKTLLAKYQKFPEPQTKNAKFKFPHFVLKSFLFQHNRNT